MTELVRERPILKPAQLNALARDLLEGSFAQVWVQGEISNFSRPASGHLYFTLKDDRAQVRCALFKQKAMYLRFAPRDGALVLVRGRVTLYEARGEYQLVLEHMEEAGEGALRIAFEAIKQALAAEGLFNAERKRALPRFIGRLAVITSPTGAAVRDVLSVFGRRFPMMDVDVLPVPVQGDGAAAEIRTMLTRAIASHRYDTILLTRGGGSLEDLWSFNDEALARAIAGSPVPIVSAVGHEVDFSLADFAADLRAPTPSAAAELMVPDRLELLASLAHSRRRMDAAMQRLREGLAQRADQASLRLRALRPQLRLERGQHRLALLLARLQSVQALVLESRAQRLRDRVRALEQQHPRLRLAALGHRADLLRQRLESAAQRDVQQRGIQLQGLARALHSLSPFATLSRGYSIVRDPATGVIVRDASQVSPGQVLEARLAVGEIEVQVTRKR
ncbi:MAG: exodeoxyribonuclease VII large subunit [Gammaproteobacteria bacterium RIFCSPHIGHO2_12_FULL_63_22]|nr:MAG: exodeoxyribonuclease VII large subunit [Gammaproteobacteria bacterium RIFCSPHIGHO2_12_FULL_63_22]